MSNRYETNYWKKEDWEAHNRLMNAAIERQREEFLEDLCSLNEFPSLIPFGFEPLRKLIKKWEGKS